ncbi:DUF1883 domain-containing protein [Kitasatospora cineracea]
MPDRRGVSLALAPLPAAAGPGMRRLSERTQRRCIWRTTQRSPVHVQRATMNFVVHDLGRQPKGAVAVINLSGSAANVRLMDPSNYRSYKSGGRHKYFGGLATRSPVRLAIPSDGQWYVTVDMAGLRGNVRSSVRMEPPPTEVMDESVREVFISHASEDKADVATPLARCLQDAGVSVWLDVLELKIGDSLRRRIDQGLARSAFGVRGAESPSDLAQHHQGRGHCPKPVAGR